MDDRSVILLAEDREEDVFLIQRAFGEAFILNPLQVVHDGEGVLAYLDGKGQYSDREEFPLPALLLLDIKMPRMDGFEVLDWIRQQPSLKSLRVVVLTSSSNMRDVNRAYELGANSFMVKPMDFNDTVQMSKFLMGHWLRDSRAPEISRPGRTDPAKRPPH
jgi:CheY-like chemotaxis protein